MKSFRYLSPFIFLTLFLFRSPESGAQSFPVDTLRVMTYNVLNYGYPYSASCPAQITSSKSQYLQRIIGYCQPDLLGLVKVYAYPNSFATDSIREQVLDSVSLHSYAAIPVTQQSGYYKVNVLYYKTSKLGYLGTYAVYHGDTAISDINLHRLYYKSPDLNTSHDTIFLNVMQAHLLSGGSNDSIRGAEMSGVYNWLNQHAGSPQNILFMGDLNTKSSSESCYAQLTTAPNLNVRFFDPANQPGNWNAQPGNFSMVLTQSTRTNDPGDCGSVGGLDSRFDHILCTSPLIFGEMGLQYLSSTYRVIGQDGQHVNAALTDPPANTSVPFDVLLDLYYMSNHLPVMIQLQVNSSTGTGAALSPFRLQFNSLAGESLNVTTACPCPPGSSLEIYTLSGTRLYNQETAGKLAWQVPLGGWPEGMYILFLKEKNKPLFAGKFCHIH